jgi:Leucine-rich repeat (LRR) protein
MSEQEPEATHVLIEKGTRIAERGTLEQQIDRALESCASDIRLYGLTPEPMPSSLGKLSCARKLTIGAPHITALPTEIGELVELRELSLLCCCGMSVLPESIGQLCNLSRFFIYGVYLKELPETIGDLTNLQFLRIEEVPIVHLPASIGRLTNLRQLCVRYTNLADLPDTICNLNNLTDLDLSGNRIKSLPPGIRCHNVSI